MQQDERVAITTASADHWGLPVPPVMLHEVMARISYRAAGVFLVGLASVAAVVAPVGGTYVALGVGVLVGVVAAFAYHRRALGPTYEKAAETERHAMYLLDKREASFAEVLSLIAATDIHAKPFASWPRVPNAGTTGYLRPKGGWSTPSYSG